MPAVIRVAISCVSVWIGRRSEVGAIQAADSIKSKLKERPRTGRKGAVTNSTTVKMERPSRSLIFRFATSWRTCARHATPAIGRRPLGRVPIEIVVISDWATTDIRSSRKKGKKKSKGPRDLLAIKRPAGGRTKLPLVGQ